LGNEYHGAEDMYTFQYEVRDHRGNLRDTKVCRTGPTSLATADTWQEAVELRRGLMNSYQSKVWIIDHSPPKSVEVPAVSGLWATLTTMFRRS
jgi:hypothetical protein